MATQNRTTLKTYFNAGDRPTEAQFGDFIDSAVNKMEDLATTTEAQAGTVDTKYMTPLKVKQSITANVPSATDAVKGLIEIATTAEVQAGTDTNRAVTPAGAKASVLQFAPVKTVNSVSPAANGNVTVSAFSDDGAWVTVSAFSNSTSSFDTNNTVRYRKKSGIIFLDGKIKGGTSQTSTVTTYQLFTLPAGFRPSRTTSFAVLKADTTTTFSIGRIDIDANGVVYGVLYSNVWTNLSGICFPL